MFLSSATPLLSGAIEKVQVELNIFKMRAEGTLTCLLAWTLG